MPADAQCYVFYRNYAGYVILFLKSTDNPSIALSKANIQLYFVNVFVQGRKAILGVLYTFD